jgi:integrase/recombinase XerD
MEMINPTLPSTEVALSATAETLRRQFLNSYRQGMMRTAYAIDLGHWYQYCVAAEVDPLRVKRLHVEEWVRQMECTPARSAPGRKASTIYRMVCVIRTFYTYAVDHEMIDRNPVPSSKALNLAKVPSVRFVEYVSARKVSV